MSQGVTEKKNQESNRAIGFGYVCVHMCACACVRVCVCVEESDRQRQRDFLELAHTVVGAGKSKVHRAGWQAGNLGKNYSSSLESKGSVDAELVLLRQPGWLSGLVLPSAQGVILETWDRVLRWAPCMEPASPSACASASLSPSVCLMNK